MTVYYKKAEIVNITLDTGATTSFIKKQFCNLLGIQIHPNNQLAKLGDGCTVLASIGEVHITFTRDKWSVKFDAIVVEKLSSDIYGGMNFLVENDISLRPKTGEITVLGKHKIYQANTLMAPPMIRSSTTPESHSLSSNYSKLDKVSVTVTPPKGVSLPWSPPMWGWKAGTTYSKDKPSASTVAQVILLIELAEEEMVLVEPRIENKVQDWPPPQICVVTAGCVEIPNISNNPIRFPKDVHIINISRIEMSNFDDVYTTNVMMHSSPEINAIGHSETETNNYVQEAGRRGLANAQNIDVSNAPAELQEKLRNKWG